MDELKVHVVTYNVGTWAPHHDLDMASLLPQKTVPGKFIFVLSRGFLYYKRCVFVSSVPLIY